MSNSIPKVKKIEKIRMSIDGIPNDKFNHQVGYKILINKIDELVDTVNMLNTLIKKEKNG